MNKTSVIEYIFDMSKQLSNGLTSKTTEFLSITPMSFLSKLILIFISLALIYIASSITKKAVKICLYIIGTLIILLTLISFINGVL